MEKVIAASIDAADVVSTGVGALLDPAGQFLKILVRTARGIRDTNHAWPCGTVLGQVGMALKDKLCHALGGGFNLPHAEPHAVILPYAVAYT